MGKGSAPSAPAAPNPVDTARASTSTNVATAIANAFLNNVNQNTPDGSLRYDQTNTYNWTDPLHRHQHRHPARSPRRRRCRRSSRRSRTRATPPSSTWPAWPTRKAIA